MIRDNTTGCIAALFFLGIIAMQIAFYGGILYLAYKLVCWVVTK